MLRSYAWGMRTFALSCLLAATACLTGCCCSVDCENDCWPAGRIGPTHPCLCNYEILSDTCCPWYLNSRRCAPPQYGGPAPGKASW